MRSRHVIATAATAVAIFLAVLVLLAVRMAGGDDPAVGTGTAQPVTSTVTPEQAPAVEQQQPYETYDDDGGYDSGTYGQAPQPEAGQAPPMQSGTS